MAVPETMTTVDISGRFVMNKTLSDSTDHILTLQGVPWYTRKIIGVATITLDVEHYTGDDTFEHIDTDQTLTGGIKGTNESRTFSGLPREHTDYLFGDVIGLSKRVKADEIAEEFLSKGWTKDTLEEEKGIIFTTASSKTETTGKTWTADQIWGFEEVDGLKRYARHVHFYTPDETVQARLVYDYAGPTQN